MVRTAVRMHAITSETLPGKAAVGDRGAVALDEELLAAQLVFAIPQPAGAQAVADQDHAVIAEQGERQAYHSRMDMHAVGDDLGRYVVSLRTGGQWGRALDDATRA